ncbi:hypothetical protein [Nocardioides furvisabuli]|uniref:hypothetical protein n=1 Tax=Nocardioides furvisabuli TaxID=375542 RepID=UPI001E52A89F|nr:hypothetical protein [Nocardioides furvisabuli]
MPKTRSRPSPGLMCPLCGADVPVAAPACRGCHLPIADVRREQPAARPASRSRAWARAIGVRVVGLALYGAVVAWCAWQLPTTLPFVVPAAAAGVLLHGVRARPWLGLVAFAVLVVVLPFLMAPALGTGALSDLAEWINDPQW